MVNGARDDRVGKSKVNWSLAFTTSLQSPETLEQIKGSTLTQPHPLPRNLFWPFDPRCPDWWRYHFPVDSGYLNISVFYRLAGTIFVRCYASLNSFKSSHPLCLFVKTLDPFLYTNVGFFLLFGVVSTHSHYRTDSQLVSLTVTKVLSRRISKYSLSQIKLFRLFICFISSI